MNVRSWALGAIVLTWVLKLTAGATPVYAHGGVARGQNVLMAWNLDPQVILGIALAGALYVAGLKRWKHPSHPVSGWQRVSFFAGLVAVFLALQSPIDPLAEHLFWVHQVQHLLLRIVGPVLLLLGAPLTPVLRGLPRWVRKGAVRPVVRNGTTRAAYKVLTHPVVSAFLFMATLYFWQMPGPHNLSLRNDVVHSIMHVTMLLTGLLFWWLIIDSRLHPRRLHYSMRFLILALTIIPNSALGGMITFSGAVLYSAYGEAERVSSLSLLADQQIGGVVLWVPGEMMTLLAAVILFLMWFQQTEKEQRAGETRGPGPPAGSSSNPTETGR